MLHLYHKIFDNALKTYEETKAREEKLKSMGYRVISIFECEWNLKYKQLSDLLTSTVHLDLIAQKEALTMNFSNWIGELEQVDDICIIGISL